MGLRPSTHIRQAEENCVHADSLAFLHLKLFGLPSIHGLEAIYRTQIRGLLAHESHLAGLYGATARPITKVFSCVACVALADLEILHFLHSPSSVQDQLSRADLHGAILSGLRRALV